MEQGIVSNGQKEPRSSIAGSDSFSGFPSTVIPVKQAGSAFTVDSLRSTCGSVPSGPNGRVG